MSKPFGKIKRGLTEAIAFARSDCDHVWRVETERHSSTTLRCDKCRVRLTQFKPVSPAPLKTR